MEIKSVCIRGKELTLDQFHLLHGFDIKNLRATQNVQIKITNNETIFVYSTINDVDPIVELPIATTLDHWEFKDFLDKEWLKKSFFCFLHSLQ